MDFVGFVDVIGANSGKVPAVPALKIIALYATGSGIIEETAAEIARFRNAGVGVVLIDQTPSQSVLAAGLADIGDIESLAGTYTAAAAACKARAKHGWQTTLYVGYDNLDALRSALGSAGVDMNLVQFGVADYNWSVETAESYLNGNADWAYCQYGDNITNADTKIPGTDTTCGEAACDIDVAKATWANQFLPKAPVSAFPTPAGLSQTPWPATVDFGWGATADATAYHLQVAGDESDAILLDVRVSANHYHGLKLPTGTYKWRVAVDAANGHESSSWTAFHVFTIM